MAAEVTICDVLCEAIEYLSKFGSNLRSRSETLKEKRIRKEKLINSHAIQKAANKILLICELSKKTLDKVETEMKNVRSLVNATQASTSDGAKTSTPNRCEESKTKYQYFRCGSRKLRICKKVPIKDYMSVKVMARQMPTVMQDRYPVYYDCKLYRLRRKTDRNSRRVSVISSDDNIKKVDIDVSKATKKSKEISETKEEERSRLNKHSKLKHLKRIKQVDDSSDTNEQDKNEETANKHSEDDLKRTKKQIVKNICTKQGSDVEEVAENEPKKRKFNDQVLVARKCKDSSDENIVQTVHNTSETIEENENSSKVLNIEDKEIKNDENIYENAPTNILISENNEDTQQTDKENNSTVEMEENESLKDIEVINSKRNKLSNEKRTKELVEENNSVIAKQSNPEINQENSDNNVSVITFSKGESNTEGNNSLIKEKEKYREHLTEQASEDETIVHKPKTKSNTEENKENSDIYNKRRNSSLSQNSEESMTEAEENKNSQKVLSSEDEVIKGNQSKRRKLLETDSESIKSDSSLEEKNKEITKKDAQESEERPLIRCVNISKLLKPDVAPSKDFKLHTKEKSVNKIKSSNEQELQNKEKLGNKLKKNTEKSKTEQEISKAKKKEEEEYWERKRKEVSAFIPKSFMINVNKLPKFSTKFLCKHSLKRITRSGSVIFELKNTPDRTTDEVLHFDKKSHEIKDKIEEETPLKEMAKAKCALLNDSDSDQQGDVQKNVKEKKNSNKEEDDQNEIKSSLLNDSSGDTPKTPDNKIQEDRNATPQSRRKHMMESMHAKRMLLTYSSSSDTEDEQLRDVLNEIKNALLEGKSSSEGENDVVKQVKEYHRKKLLKSSSDEDSNNESTTKKQSISKSPEFETSKKTEECHDEKENTEIVNENVDLQSSSSNDKMVRSKSKPTGSSTQNSDNQEDKDVDRLINLNTLTKTRRRRESTETDKTEGSNSTKKEKTMPKAPQIISEEFLAEDSHSDASIAESEPADVEDLSSVTVPALNGGEIGRFGIDDLLEESDSSTSHNEHEHEKVSEDNKKEDTDDSENVKLKRRKAHAISSDSEVGSSRPKQTVKVSDFEDSEEESSESVKKNKRKKKGSDSDASASSSVEGQKKRRRIKTVDESEASDSDTENEGRNKHGRKNIRKVMGKDQLEEATKKAARQEKERIARIAERQKLYNNLEFDESGKPDEVVLEKVVLDFDPGTKEPLIQVDRGLVKKLKPHQANGIKFMWDACFESVKRIKKDKGSGCILAHCMGLGKTLQVVTLTHTLLTHCSLTGVNRVLVVCPLSTVLNWVNEFHMWLKHTEADFEVDIYELSRYKQNSERAYQLQQWFEGGGVCVLGYEMFRNLSADNVKKFKKKMLKNFQEALVDPGPDLVVCDEGHLLKNEKTSLSQSMNRVKSYRRIVLTGTPLQNNLKEYYCMVQFVKPNLLGKYNEYLNRFVNPITNGQYTDSTEHDIKVMKRRSHVLHKMLDGAVQRRDYGVLAPFLPPKHEYVLFITLTEVQIKLYQFYLDNYSRRPLPGKSSGFLFPDFQALQRIWTHPLVLKYNSERYEIMQQKKREREEEDSEGSLADFIDDDSTPEESSTEESSEDLSDVSDDSRKKSKKKKSAKKKRKDSKVTTRRGTRANPVELEEEKASSDVEEIKYENPTEWWIKMMEEDELENLRNSHKLVLLFEILRQCEAIGDKLLVFSQSLYSLDLIEHFLGKVDEATQEGRIDEKLGGHVGSWSPGIDYFRLDGSTSCENRSIWCKNFNREDNPRARLFLISTRAGGLGINLVAANRVVIFDVSWNPSHDVQSIFRVYRFGQKKPCYVYRFLAMGTMEEKIYERQVTKQAISKRVIDEQQIDRHYAENDLAELYKFEPRPPSPRPLPPLPKDRLFAEMLKEHEHQIYKYHEHDSLLENKEEETLSEEERKAAWEDFENEKNRPPPAPFPATWPMHNGMAPNLWAQQQQQMAYAAIAAMLRKDMPNINDNQIRDMLPHIFNSNPAMFGGYDYGLMQKMAEIYKYTQAPMMNPAMMNPVMNTAGGMGGTSGLQYEPPWQRQHQQQQQMRLHQLMQQQNSSGAKYYAGGLGSRDPIAMALQQQRAREIMLGERAAGRPRGRPPLQPRAPSATPAADVVNLDSD